MIGFSELLVILVVVLLVFGASRLPDLGDALGKAVRGYKAAARGEREIDVTPKEPPGSGTK